MDNVTPNLDCYDIFNDYLGLSSVVGGQEDPYLLMQSILQQGKSHNFSSQSNDSGEATKRANVTRPETSCLTPPIPGEIARKNDSYRSSAVSDVERLFGRGATLQKTVPTFAPGESAKREAITSSQQWRPPVANGQATVGSGFNSNSYSDISRENCIHSALDAILHKYNRIYNQQKALENVNYSARRNPKPGNTRLAEIASLTAALAKAAVSYNGDQVRTSPIYTGGYTPKQEHTLQSKCDPHVTQTRFVGCSFCKNNKEVKEWFLSHQLKDSLGRVTCPVLRSYVCPLCDATADNAHTVGHCPLNPDRRNSLPLAIRLKANATGKRKYV